MIRVPEGQFRQAAPRRVGAGSAAKEGMDAGREAAASEPGFTFRLCVFDAPLRELLLPEAGSAYFRASFLPAVKSRPVRIGS